jgi:hypothetical protein
MAPILSTEEYIEQAHFFRVLGERLPLNESMQDLLAAIREELLVTTKLPMAIDYLLSELKHSGVFSPALAKLDHYFTPFQAYVVQEAENDRGRFDLRVGFEILRREAEYRVEGATAQGLFLYQFESLCRNRMRYDYGLQAIAGDPMYDEAWRDWILSVRHRVGMVDLADLIYVASEHYNVVQTREGKKDQRPGPGLFGAREGRIALANRQKDPLVMFAALHRQLGYPEVPRPAPIDESRTLLPQMLRRMERLEQRLKLVEEEQRGGIDLTRFMKPPSFGPDKSGDST